MRKYLKLGILVVSVFILIFILVGVFRGISNIGNNEINTKHQSSAVMPSKKEYEKIQVGDAKTGKGGMTIAEVEKIIGKPTTQTEGRSENAKMTVYTFAGSSGPNSILITFINGHAAGKTQTGLE